MSRTKILMGDCQHCGGRVEFPAESVGLTAECPHCRQHTELFLAAPPQTSTVPVKTIVFAIIALLILVGGWIGTQMALKRAQRLTERANAASANAAAQPASAATPSEVALPAGFRVSAIMLEKTSGSSQVYAVGLLRNDTDRQRRGVKVELDLFDASGRRVGAATDTLPMIEPRAEWRFKARVVEADATAAQLKAIREEP
ncbi:MAG: hypothetical protein IH623_23890 [Verrucomicrobia bacterium]|nr:hypothetical protein [Verrucomicrobiota bacterium]